jgi:hypothetical protein
MMPVNALAGVVAPQVDADLMTWARQCTQPPDSKYLLAHHNFVRTGKDDGWWTTLTGIRFLNAPGTDGYLINVKSPLQRMTQVGTGVQEAYYGWQGDGSTGYLDTGKTPTQLGMTAGASPSITALVFSQSDIPGVYSACGATGGVNTGVVRLRAGAVMGVWGSSSLQVQAPVKSGRGLAGVVVNSATGGFIHKNGDKVAMLGTAASLATGTFRYGRGGSGSAYEPAMLAYGFDGPSVTEAQAASIEKAVRKALTALGTLIEDEPEVPISINNAFERSDTGDWTGSIGRILQPPMSDTQENVTQYTRETAAVVFTADAYTTVVGDLYKTLRITSGAAAKTITLMSAVTAGSGALQVFRKIDRGVGVTTINGVIALDSEWDHAIFVSDGAAWVLTQDYQNFLSVVTTSTSSSTFAWAANNYDATTADLRRNIHCYPGGTNRTVTILPAATAGSGGKLVVRKMDEGAGTVTFNGVVLSDMYDYASFSSNGATWTQDQTIVPLEIGYIAFPATSLSIRPWGHAKYTRQTLITLDEFFWGTRGLGTTPGTITAWAKKPNDTMGGINLTNGFSGRTEFDTYELAMGEMFVKAAYTLGYLAKDDTTLTTFDGVYRAAGWGWLDIATQFGYDVSGWAAYLGSASDLYTDVSINTGAVGHRAYFYDNRDTIFVDDAVNGQFKVTRNKILLGQGRLADIRTRGYSPVGGITLDLEWADNRSPAQFVRSIRGLARLCHAKSYTLTTLSHAVHKGTGTYSGWRIENANALLTAAAGVNGIDENIDLHVLITNSTAPTATAMTAEIVAQMNFFKGVDGTLPLPIDNLAIELRVGGTAQEIPVDYVTALRSLRSTYGFSHAWITPLYAQFGGDLERIPNQRLAQFLGVPTS